MANRLKGLVQTVIEWIDGRLDSIPKYEDGKWYRYGCWGCQWNLSRFWDDDMAAQWKRDH